MRIFVDTNIVSELLEERSLVDYIDLIFENAEQKGWTRVLSVGSFYTITFLTERFFRRQGIGLPQLVEQQRKILNSLLQAFEIADISKEELSSGVSDVQFNDLEDSYQYQSAIKSKCSVLLTINKKDFMNVTNGNIQILSPQEFVDTYID